MRMEKMTPKRLAALKTKAPFNLWACPGCGRQNLQKFTHCPRCRKRKA